MSNSFRQAAHSLYRFATYKRLFNTLPAMLCLLLLLAGTGGKAAANGERPFARQGVLDLRNTAIDKIDTLDGEWGFYWKQLLSPDSGYRIPPVYVPYPRLWKNTVLNGRTLPTMGYATYQLTVLLPPDRPKLLAFEVPDVYCCFRLYVNDTLLAGNGRPAPYPQMAVPFWSTRDVLFSGPGDTLQLLLQVANFWHSKGGPYKSITMGPLRQIVQHRDVERAFDLLLAGCLLMGGLLYMGLYFFGRRDKAILYFSLFCILYSYRMIGTERYVLHSVLPDISWFLSIRFEYLALSLGIYAFVKYTQSLFPEDVHKTVIRWILFFCLFYSAVILVTKPYVFSAFLPAFLCLMFVCAAYSFYVYIQAVRNRRTGSRFAFIGIALLLVILVLSNLRYFGMIAPYKGTIFTCYLAFFFLQSLALSHRFAQSFQQAMEEAKEGLKAKSEFLSTMSHEIRTPLNSVIGMAHLLKKDPRPDQREHLDVLQFSAGNLLSIVNNILDYNKIEAGKISFEYIPMDIAQMARHIAAGLKNTVAEKGIELRVEIDAALNKPVMGDPTRFAQVINNLLQNAVKFTKEGWVCLKMEVLSATETEVTVFISIEDTGIGIEADKQELIFERFTQAESSTSRSYGGTGLGLSISQKILQLLGTELKIKSTPGEGSCFFFTQTFRLSKESIPASSEEETEQRLEGVSVLLVEDHPFNVMLAKTILTGWGVKVEVAENGQEALDKLATHRYDLVLMDLHMPVMDGYEATRILREKGETLPVIALTANTPGEIERGFQNSGLTDVLVKPFSPAELYRIITRYLPGRS